MFIKDCVVYIFFLFLGKWSWFYNCFNFLLKGYLGIKKNGIGNGIIGKIELFMVKVVIYVIWVKFW